MFLGDGNISCEKDDETDDFCHSFGTRFPQGSKASGITGNEYVGTASCRLAPYAICFVPKSGKLHNIGCAFFIHGKERFYRLFHMHAPPEPQGLTVLVSEGIILR